VNAVEPKPSLTARWKSWGVAFNTLPCHEPGNLEQLLVDTAKALDQNARLLVMTVTWLAEHHEIVEMGRLAQLAQGLRGRDSARLGLLLETAQEHVAADVFRPVLALCQPWEPPEPLFEVDRIRPALARLARERASRISLKWGLWAEPLERLKPEALRPPSWIARQNPAFMLRKLLKGDVRCKVITALAEQGLTQVSETDLTLRAGCTRRAMHLALENLEISGLIVRQRRGRRYAISLPQRLPRGLTR
jgi:biotin operon repressor